MTGQQGETDEGGANVKPVIEERHMKPALSGVRVVDLTQFESGTACTETLAWLGADVVKIEEPTKGESGRLHSQDKSADSYFFIVMNANKRSVACDIKSERGREVLRQLIRKADVFVENMAPGVIERLGFGYDVVSDLNPKIVYAQIKGFAPDGPYAKFLSFDYMAQAVGGAMSFTGNADGVPLKPGPSMADSGAGLHCALGIVSALYQRQFSGRGQKIEVSMQDAVINLSRIGFAAQLMNGRPPQRQGNQGVLGATAPCAVYHCKPGGANDYVYVYTSRGGNQQWQRLLKVIGREDLETDPRFITIEARVAHAEEVDALLSAWCAGRTKIEAMQTLQKGGVPAGAVLDTQELIDDPHLRKREMFVTIEHPVRGSLTIPGFAVKMSASHVPVGSAPLLGAHTDEVLSQWLGMSHEQIQELRHGAKVAL